MYIPPLDSAVSSDNEDAILCLSLSRGLLRSEVLLSCVEPTATPSNISIPIMTSIFSSKALTLEDD